MTVRTYRGYHLAHNISLILLVPLLVVGCADYTPSNRDIGAATGTAIGAGLGAIVGNQVGDPGEGVAIGAAAGAIAGGLIGYGQDTQGDRSVEQDEVLRRQEAELIRQQREIEDLRRQRYSDERFENRGYDSGRASSYGSENSSNSDFKDYKNSEIKSRRGDKIYEKDLSDDDSSKVEKSIYNDEEYGDDKGRDDYRY